MGWVKWGLALALASSVTFGTATAWAHCDTLDGPVVADARKALSTGDVQPVLKWVGASEEAEIRAAFKDTVAVRAQSAAARDLADRYFFETLVRVHRAGEGAPYTGLKPAGTPVEAGIRAADEAIEKGGGDAVAREIAAAVEQGIRTRYARASEAKKHAADSVSAGREYVAAYVEYIHFVEGIHQAVSGAGHHGAEAEHAAPKPAAHGH